MPDEYASDWEAGPDAENGSDYESRQPPETCTLLQAQRKNVEAMTVANQMAMVGMQMIVRRQSELIREMTEDFNESGAFGTVPEDPQIRHARQAEQTKAQLERSLASMKEMAEMVNRSHGVIDDIISNRISEALDELRNAEEGASA